MIALDVAAASAGRAVVYSTPARRSGRDPRPPEDGVIVRANDSVVFVRYSWGVAATNPADLDFAAPTEETP